MCKEPEAIRIECPCCGNPHAKIDYYYMEMGITKQITNLDYVSDEGVEDVVGLDGDGKVVCEFQCNTCGAVLRPTEYDADIEPEESVALAKEYVKTLIVPEPDDADEK